MLVFFYFIINLVALSHVRKLHSDKTVNIAQTSVLNKL